MRGVVARRYKLIAKLGQGGMGVVYKAHDRKLDREVALKRVASAVGGHRIPTMRLERFRKEAAIIAKLNHPHIVQVYDTGVDRHGDWLVMELMAGGSLAEALRQRGRYPLAEAAALVRGIAQGLACAHDRGIYHRDIKPSNILLAGDGTPKVADFGIAKMKDGAGTGTESYALGTRIYMPPEQHRDAKAANQTSDIYALGKTFYELLTGITPPCQVDLDLLPAEAKVLGPVLLKCVRERQEDRYPDCEDFLAAVDEALAGRKGRGTRTPESSPLTRLRPKLQARVQEALFMAEQGSRTAMCLLGRLYAEGRGVPQDDQKSIEWYTKAAELGKVLAQNVLGCLYYSGKTVPRDHKKAVVWFTKAAEQGDALAQRNLGRLYCAGQGVPRDYKKALKWFSEAAAQGLVQAQYDLGVMHEEGRGVPCDGRMAFEWYAKAAARGYAKAQFNIGMMHDVGHDMPQDYMKAVEWYAKAARKGHAAAQFHLGEMYDNGLGVPQDYKTALEWYSKAAEQGHAPAQFNLAVMHDMGQGVPQDFKTAAEWYAKAATQGYSAAQFNLGVMHEHGRGMPMDLAKAFDWYIRAAEQGHPTAQFNLGELYADGQGLARDYGDAFDWLNHSTIQGEDGDPGMLGWMHERKGPTPQDLVRAYSWFDVSAKCGEEEAPQSRDIVAEHLDAGQLAAARALSAKLYAEIKAKKSRIVESAVS